MVLGETRDVQDCYLLKARALGQTISEQTRGGGGRVRAMANQPTRQHPKIFPVKKKRNLLTEPKI